MSMKFSLTLNDVNICDLEFDLEGKYRISVSRINDTHRFARTVLSIIDDLPPGVDLRDGLPPHLEVW